ncbi:hypothetical protein HPB51_015764 [Rhipicephalus microplus]|uniref:Tick transposon n=1 Tax=Rhipicephalus microplus TaxID=6941 RepID=A0A9J6EU53_RHIMP|nr:hypothetical protein HPB51_015764 [Rhipicephalus microplus]
MLKKVFPALCNDVKVGAPARRFAFYTLSPPRLARIFLRGLLAFVSEDNCQMALVSNVPGPGMMFGNAILCMRSEVQERLEVKQRGLGAACDDMLKNNPSHIYDVLNEAKRELAVGVLKKALPSGDDDTETELFATRNVSSVRVKVQLFNMIHSCTPAETASLTMPDSPRRTTNFNPD